ncbi:MAG: hypothetical protein ABI624_22245 [Casimicrobiaceae bacterium]
MPIGAFLICLAFLGVGLFCVRLAIRLLKGQRAETKTVGLMSSRAWRITGWIFVAAGSGTAVSAAVQRAYVPAGMVLGLMLGAAWFCWTAARDANKPLQPMRAVEPNGKREPAGSGPRG